MPEPSGHLLHNLLYFGRLLRAMGLDVQPDGVSNLVKATTWVVIDHRQDFYNAARTIFVRRQQDLVAFDQAFDQFWRVHGIRELSSKVEKRERLVTEATGKRPQSGSSMASPITMQYSYKEVLRQKDFAAMDRDELDAIRPILRELTWKLGKRRTRRWRTSGQREIDVRLTLRESLRHEGEPLELHRRSRQSRPRNLVVLADISGSMERYSNLLLHFIFGLSGSLAQSVEAFVFGTRLTRISRYLRGHDVDRALAAVAQRVPDWSGGTRIGQALKTFNYQWARRVLARGAVVMLVSDGWDRGEVELLRTEMARLQRSSFRLIWLNPLLGSPDYEPLTRGMQAALPFVDDFLPMHNLSSMQDIARRLESLDERRPQRKQRPVLQPSLRV